MEPNDPNQFSPLSSGFRFLFSTPVNIFHSQLLSRILAALKPNQPRDMMLSAPIILLILQHRLVSSEQLKNLSHGLTRHIRSLGFPQGSGMGIFFAIAIPIDIPDKSISFSWYFEANYGMPTINDSAVPLSLQETSQASCCDAGKRKRSLDRRMLYDVLQSRLESNGYPGRACLLRTICESARFPFGLNGLVGDITRIIFTPSSSRREEQLDHEFIEAENTADCSKFSEKCEISLLESISRSFEM